jgi:hypothetical protein
MSVVDFLSQVGGILSLCVGISLISAIEIIYWLSMKLATQTTKICKQKNWDITSSTA